MKGRKPSLSKCPGGRTKVSLRKSRTLRPTRTRHRVWEKKKTGILVVARILYSPKRPDVQLGRKIWDPSKMKGIKRQEEYVFHRLRITNHLAWRKRGLSRRRGVLRLPW